ncbi:hypothetical protein PsorP6_000721 [Peronosclerospora sorghi]|uniref:Uncharacterized protein n=1 Tax=Peronosclerospora sorghi TaxID=230839 RepID=A0ACC0WXT1_9STRA|nr:hypothetical protein PsorP6_000721 [Peronosclerospora sorghi]
MVPFNTAIICGDYWNMYKEALHSEYALAPNETEETWKWFFELVARILLEINDKNTVLINDREKGLLNAAADVVTKGAKEFCCFHIASNIPSQFGIQRRKLFWKCADAETDSFPNWHNENCLDGDEKVEVITWIEQLDAERRERNEKVSCQWIAELAVAMAIINFVVSERWVSNFMRPNNLSMHETTNLTTLTNNELFILHALPPLYSRRTGLHDAVGRQAIYYEDPRNDTVNKVGARHVVTQLNGFQSIRNTAFIAVTANGRLVGEGNSHRC